jgi:UDP-N-acetylglucosamine:LPS N-acetylglucosamine transferase
LSRFENHLGTETPRNYKFVAIVSGVEPARSRFESLLRNVLAKVPGRHAIILGKPVLGVKSWSEGNIDFHTHLPDREFAEAVRGAQWVVSRGGYSTVMDMAVLGAKCIFVPTPGQYEQVILAQDLAREGYAATISESNFSIETLLAAMSEKGNVSLPKPKDNALLKNAVSDVLTTNNI